MNKSFIFALIFLLSACGGSKFENAITRAPDYRNSDNSANPLLLPPNLKNVHQEEMIIPSDGFKSYREQEAKLKRNKQGLIEVLPELEKVTINEALLTVDSEVNQTWEITKKFLSYKGLSIKDEDPINGLLVTNWLENSSNEEFTAVGKVMQFLGMRDSGSRDKYSFQFKRLGNKTQIQVRHGQLSEVTKKAATKDKIAEVAWEETGANNELAQEIARNLAFYISQYLRHN